MPLLIRIRLPSASYHFLEISYFHLCFGSDFQIHYLGFESRSLFILFFLYAPRPFRPISMYGQLADFLFDLGLSYTYVVVELPGVLFHTYYVIGKA